MSISIEQSAFAGLDTQKRLLNQVFKGELSAQGRFGFRGELAIKFATAVADEARPPELLAQQVISSAEPGAKKISFFLLSSVFWVSGPAGNGVVRVSGTLW